MSNSAESAISFFNQGIMQWLWVLCEEDKKKPEGRFHELTLMAPRKKHVMKTRAIMCKINQHCLYRVWSFMTLN